MQETNGDGVRGRGYTLKAEPAPTGDTIKLDIEVAEHGTVPTLACVSYLVKTGKVEGSAEEVAVHATVRILAPAQQHFDLVRTSLDVLEKAIAEARRKWNL